MSKKPFNVELTEDERLMLEALRVRMGLRSHGETVRALINQAAGGAPIEALSPAELPDVRAKAPIPAKAAVSGVQLGPAPFVSRLKPDKPKR